jgi:hypothetical protein
VITHPKSEEILDALAMWLQSVQPKLEGRDNFLARVAVNAVNLIKRENASGQKMEDDQVARMAQLLKHQGSFDDLNTELCMAIRDGKIDPLDKALLALLRASAEEQIAIDNPKYVPEPKR